MPNNENAYLQERLNKVLEMITAYENAIIAIAEGGVQSYTLNTGQSTQTVTKHNLKDLNERYESLLNLKATLEARLTGCGVSLHRPCW